jgi:RNA polymerase sigma factor (TIGR02999 family)
LHEAALGDDAAAARLLPLVYDQLRRAAQQQIASERRADGRDHTLSATALVHEAFLKLVGPRQVPWDGRGHFYAAVAQAMRQVLIDHARAKATIKRGGKEPDPLRLKASAKHAALALECLPDLTSEEKNEGLLILDEAISRLEMEDAQAAAVTRLKFFAGLTNEQTAEALDVSTPTVKRAWAFARGWLKTAIESDDVREGE